jgi:hypothetical protein
MSRRTGSVGLGVLLWAGGLGLLGLHLANDEPSARLLSGTEMRDVAKGAAPAPCTHRLHRTLCTDFTGCNTMPPGACQGPCVGCTNPNAFELLCSQIKPLFVQRCNQIVIPNGCGTYLDPNVSRCQIGAAGQCVCLGPPTTIPCHQNFARFRTPCTVVP